VRTKNAERRARAYFLALIQQDQIAAARWPVGELQKSEVRRLAGQFDLVIAGKKDSQGICLSAT